jgi:hypothetical protein
MRKALILILALLFPAIPALVLVGQAHATGLDGMISGAVQTGHINGGNTTALAQTSGSSDGGRIILADRGGHGGRGGFGGHGGFRGGHGFRGGDGFRGFRGDHGFRGSHRFGGHTAFRDHRFFRDHDFRRFDHRFGFRSYRPFYGYGYWPYSSYCYGYGYSPYYGYYVPPYGNC